MVTKVAGDYTNDGKTSIGDLALMVKAYGKTVDSPDWNEWKQFDINNDKAIDIVDLSALAQLIINEDF
ncbi:dockerin type I domain-containing protein [Paenibacillus silvestris]|uniref:dockerin type I domain-containing protein n=1 Tax=Paenibacillus silvestris TaxID=2606219 RepID=UPI002E2E785F|nr:dockerin type I domain-containing protein [Paenibacillus silvestris]